MSEYKLEDQKVDTQHYLDSELGKFHMSIFTSKLDGLLASATDPQEQHPDRYLAKYAQLKEVIDIIRQPLGDDIPSRGL